MTIFSKLHISFSLYMKGRFYSEYEIAMQLHQIKKIANSKDYYLPTMDGAISMVYQGEELLGKDCLDEIFTVHIDTPRLVNGNSTETYMPISGRHLFCSPNPQQGKIKYELSAVGAKGIIVKTRLLSLVPFIQKWNYMRYRLIRLKAFLANTENNVKEWESWGYGTEEWKRIVGVNKINAIMNDNIVDVLTDSTYR